MATKYLIEVFWSEEDEGFVAVAPDLPGCCAFGATAAEAMREMEDAMEAAIEAYRHSGEPLPEARAKWSG